MTAQKHLTNIAKKCQQKSSFLVKATTSQYEFFVGVFQRSLPSLENVTVPNKQKKKARRQCFIFTSYFLDKQLFSAGKILE